MSRMIVDKLQEKPNYYGSGKGMGLDDINKLITEVHEKMIEQQK